MSCKETLISSHINEICNPQFSIRFNQEKEIDLECIRIVTQPLYCKQCNQILSSRNRSEFWNSIIPSLFSRDWDTSQDVNDFSSILSVLFCKEFDESSNSASEEFDASSPASSSFFASWRGAVDKLVLCLCRLCSETPISQERSNRVRRVVTDFLQCFDRWRQSALQHEELECDCCGWIQRQVQARASDLKCPNPQCGCKVGKIEGGNSGNSGNSENNENNETLRVVLFRSSLLWVCLLQ